MSNAQAQWRIALAQQILTPAYAAHSKVAAVAFVGGVARGIADALSDIDLAVYWHTSPTVDERNTVIHHLNGEITALGDTQDSEPDPALRQWWDVYTLGGGRAVGLKIDVNHVLVSTQTAMIRDVVEMLDPNPKKSGIIHAVKRAYVLYGESILANWRTAAGDYPLALSEKLVREGLSPLRPWALEMLIRREDWLYYHDLMTGAIHKLARLCLGLNRLYPPKNLKHIRHLCAEMTIRPDHFAERLIDLLHARSLAVIAPYRELVTDLFDLVDDHMPQIDTTEGRADFAYRRPEHHESPLNTRKS